MASILRDGFHEMLLRWCKAYVSAERTPDDVEPKVEILDFEDYFLDMRQTDDRDIDFEGHEYDILRDELHDPEKYDQEAVKSMDDSTRSKDQFVRRPLYDRSRVRCCWLPRHRLLLTLPAKGGNKALRVQEYKGPPQGPYIGMALTKRRGSIIPTSRASFLLDLHDFCAVTQRQVFLQADQFCEFFLVDSQFEQAADIHRTAEYGRYYTVDNINAVKREIKGGVNQGTMLTSMQASDMFNERAGNLRLLAGQSTGEPTARQANQLGFGVDQMVRDCRSALNKFARQIYDQVAWYILNDDVSPMKQVEWTDDAGITSPSWWMPGVGRQLQGGDPELEIIPDSMIDRSSEEQAAALIDSVRTVASLLTVPGNAPVFLNHQEVVEHLGELRNQPELAKLFGQAPDVESLVPGNEAAGGVIQQGEKAPVPSGGPSPMDRMKEKMMFQATQPQQSQGGGY
jgi:hypothetical protein